MSRAARFWTLAALFAGASCSDGVTPSAFDGVPLMLSLQAPAAVSQAETDELASAFDRVDRYVVTVRDSVTSALLEADTIFVSTSGAQHELNVELEDETIGLRVLLTVVGLEGALELYRASAYFTVSTEDDAAPVAIDVRYTGPGLRGRVTDENGVGLSGVTVELFRGETLEGMVQTEEDGTYLFLDLTNGFYQVQPTPPSTFVCPAFRTISVQLPTDALVADFQSSSVTCDVSLLVLSGGDVDDTQTVADMFAQTPGVTTSTFFFVNTTPGLEELRRYDVVLLLANGLFNESRTLGSELESYVQLGGNVVVASFYWQNRSDAGNGTSWGTLESIDPFGSTGGAVYSSDVLDPNATVAHPLTLNVNVLSSTGFRGGVTAQPATTVVASWLDGTPLVGYRILSGGQRIVGVSLFPASGPAASGDTQALWENAVTWAGMAGGPAS